MLFRGKMKSALLLLTTIALTACVASEEVKNTTPGNINKNAPYYWSEEFSFPVDLYYSKSFNADEVQNITEMSAAWKASVENKKEFFKHKETSEKSSPTLNLDSLGSDGIFGIYKLDHWQDLPYRALAVTQLFGRRHNIGSSTEFVRIEHADILINNSFTFDTGDSLSGSAFDFRTVVLHEMGHFLGLLHKDGDSIMNDSILPGEKKRSPTHIDAHDIAKKFHITLSTATPMSLANSSAAKKVEYRPKVMDAGTEVRIIMELRADGECVHKENGTETQRHFLKISR